MKRREERFDAGLDRRGFCALGVRTAAAMVALPAVALVGSACGGGEESGTVAPVMPDETDPIPEAAPSEAPSQPATAPEPATSPDPVPAGGGDDALVTEIAAVAPVVKTLQYVNESAKADQRCSNCQLYTAQSGGKGKCQLFVQGLVKETGWCASWVAKVT